MSATNRKPVRRALDHYPTPAWAIDPILRHLPQVTTLDPCCGDGAILDRLVAAGWPKCTLTGVELDACRATECADRTGITVHQGDFLRMAPSPGCRGLIVANPPYTHALAFVRMALGCTLPVGGTVAMLLRLAFLESAERVAFHREHPADVFVLPSRPSFTANGKTDSSAYGWFVWGPGRGGRWSIVDVEKPAKAKRGKR